MDMGVGNQTQVFCQSSVSLNHWAISTATYLEISFGFDLTYIEWGALLNLLVNQNSVNLDQTQYIRRF